MSPFSIGSIYFLILDKSNSSVWVSLLIESRLNFSNLLIKVICIDFNVLPLDISFSNSFILPSILATLDNLPTFSSII